MTDRILITSSLQTDFQAEIKTSPGGRRYRICTVDLNALMIFYETMNINPEHGPRTYYYCEFEHDNVLGVRGEPKEEKPKKKSKKKEKVKA